jgi:hypothetical protein
MFRGAIVSVPRPYRCSTTPGRQHLQGERHPAELQGVEKDPRSGQYSVAVDRCHVVGSEALWEIDQLDSP